MANPDGRPKDFCSQGDLRKEAHLWLKAALKTHGSSFSQFQTIMKRLAGKCVAEANNRGENALELSDRLEVAYEILNDIWHAHKYYQYKYEKRILNIADDEELNSSALSKIRGEIWSRINPENYYYSGKGVRDQLDIHKDTLTGAFRRYMENDWLEDAELEWIVADMLLTYEVNAFGEWMKCRAVPIGTNIDIYSEADGVAERIRDLVAKALFVRYALVFLFVFLLPAGLIFLLSKSIEFYVITLIAIAYAIALSMWGLLALARRVWRRTFKVKSEKEEIAEKAIELRGKMLNVWMALSGPIVSPIRVKDALDDSTKAGAVWDNSIWTIIGRAIARDPNVWLAAPYQ